MSGPPIDSPRVVLVEDDPDVLSSLKFAFELEGFSVSSHDSAESLLKAGPLPDHACLVVDYRLPGMDGLAMIRRIREHDRDVPALLITTLNPEVARRAADDGVLIVDKPLVTGALVDAVRRRLA
jgi:FixJ family two-component response regulator